MLLESCLTCCARSAPCKSVKISALRRKLWKSMLITASPQSGCHNSISSATGSSIRKTFLGSPWRAGTSSRRVGANTHGVANRSCSYEAQVVNTQPLTADENTEGAGDIGNQIDWSPLAHALLKHLSLAQMESLCDAVERALTGHSDCIHIKDRFVQLGRYEKVDLAQLVCRLWRWPDATPNHPIVSFCDSTETTKVDGDNCCCINPYHWSLRLDIPTTANTKDGIRDDDGVDFSISTGMTTLDSGVPFGDTKDIGKWHPSTEDSALASSIAPSSTEAYTSDMYSAGGGHPGHSSSLNFNNNNNNNNDSPTVLPPVWCSLSYWELLTHVGGRWFPVRSPTLHLVADYNPPPSQLPASQSCLDLGALQSRDPPARQLTAPVEPDTLRCVSRTRRRIGAGLVLTRNGSFVWLHNRSPAPVFVSPQCQLTPHSGVGSTAARRLPPGHALQLFDLDLWSRCPRRDGGRGGTLPLAPPGPVDPRVVHVSFGKGWGHNYKRQDITLCPCRLEILFHLPPYG